MKLVPLTQGEFAMVDDEDFDHVMQFKWRCLNDRKRSKKYADTKIRFGVNDWRKITMHRFLMPHHLEHTDHKDGNGLNNQKDNLRPATRLQNSRNRKLQRHSSHFKGVHFLKALSKWQAYIRVNKVKKHLGCFESEKDAAMAYDCAAIIHFGEFARTNQQIGAL